MKKLYFLLLTAIYLTGIACKENGELSEYEQNEPKGQEPVNTFSTWFPIGAEWRYECYTDELNPITYTVEKDTVVNDRVCRIIRGENGKSKDIVYEENGCIYYYFNDAFRKIYDINVEEGDTVDFELKTYYFDDVITTNVMPFKINNVLTRVIDGVELKEVYAKSINGGIVHTYIERIGMDVKSSPLGGIIPNYYDSSVVAACNQHTQLMRYQDSEINTEFRWIVIMKLNNCTLTHDTVIKELSLKHGVSLWQIDPRWSSEYLSLAGSNCNQEKAINDFLATGKFEEGYFYEYDNMYNGHRFKGCD